MEALAKDLENEENYEKQQEILKSINSLLETLRKKSKINNKVFMLKSVFSNYNEQ